MENFFKSPSGDFNATDNDYNVVIKYYVKDGNGVKSKDYNFVEKYSSLSDTQMLVGAMWSNRGITAIYKDGVEPLLEYDGTSKELKINSNYSKELERVVDELHSRESLVAPEDFQVFELYSRQIVQLANIVNGTLTSVSKETFFNQVEDIENKLYKTNTRNEILNYLKEVIEDKNVNKLNKRWAMQIHNGITLAFSKTEAYKEASANNLVDALRTPLDYIAMTSELLKTAEANGTPIDVTNVCKKNGIDLTIGFVSDRAVFNAVADAFQEMIRITEKKKMETDILHLNRHNN